MLFICGGYLVNPQDFSNITPHMEFTTITTTTTKTLHLRIIIQVCDFVCIHSNIKKGIKKSTDTIHSVCLVSSSNTKKIRQIEITPLKNV